MQTTPLLQALEDTGFTGGEPVACYAVIDPSGELLIVSQLPGNDHNLTVLDEDGRAVHSSEHLREVTLKLRSLDEDDESGEVLP